MGMIEQVDSLMDKAMNDRASIDDLLVNDEGLMPMEAECTRTKVNCENRGRKHRVTVLVFGHRTRQRWVCSKEGMREAKWLNFDNRVRTAKKETRENCNAALCVHFSSTTGAYNVTEFSIPHSHGLVPPQQVHFIRSHREVNEADLEQVMAMRRASIPTSRAYSYIINKMGGYQVGGL
ncbi:hypothetical protein M0R45_035157 [Rubus argutus]|uniref:FAR1 domain-containing protein n=1 Tax=Rubus argutus TaxID=59490 RepID=A0AAW1VTC8_RUBAR